MSMISRLTWKSIVFRVSNRACAQTIQYSQPLVGKQQARRLHATSAGSASVIDSHHQTQPEQDSATGGSIMAYFQNLNGEQLATVRAEEGENILDLAHKNGIELEGSCEGKVACSTCHVVLSSDDYGKLTPPRDDENDMLDMAHGLTETLGCQVQVVRDVEGLTITVPNTFGLRKKVL
ncbi:hypothetical protein EW146_g2775 [Bondarzewia mesenterica]|uniref:2Fe-2S ferredoxin-type domain-containing protein n=1 Tax=Bondarzewia mesenterica TaxID=1095465 RepID=A0A4S4M050_9AGAM|nr:hypothetical protein EW146_g2775 [Bondarzewia mesenterica]